MPDSEAPLPPVPSDLEATKRPGTSGTELNLRSDRQKASTAFQRAQRAEAKYRAHRQATNARKDIQSSKEHFRLAGSNLKKGVAYGWAAVKAVPAVMREKRENRREKSEAKKKAKAEKKRQMLVEKVRESTPEEVDPEV